MKNRLVRKLLKKAPIECFKYLMNEVIKRDVGEIKRLKGEGYYLCDVKSTNTEDYPFMEEFYEVVYLKLENLKDLKIYAEDESKIIIFEYTGKKTISDVKEMIEGMFSDETQIEHVNGNIFEITLSEYFTPKIYQNTSEILHIPEMDCDELWEEVREEVRNIKINEKKNEEKRRRKEKRKQKERRRKGRKC